MSRSSRSVLALAGGLVLLVGAAVLGAAVLSGCSVDVGGTGVRGSGNVVSENRPVSGITGVALGTQGDLVIEVGSQESLRVEAEDNLLQYLKTTVSNGRLTIDAAEGYNLRPKKAIHYYLTVKNLDSIETSSSGDVTAPVLSGRHFAVTISSSGSVEIAALQADSLDVRLSSSGDLKIGGGQVGSQTVRLSSSGGYEARDLASKSGNVELTSSGDATIRVSDQLEGGLSSSGDLKYYGSPQLNVDTSSSGGVKRAGD